MNDSSKSTDTGTWFTEIFGDEGTSFGLEITAKLHEEQTQYQFLEVYDTKTFGKLMVLDGCVMLTTRDNFLYHEMMSHPALFTHPNPKKVAIIGGGDCGTLREVLKHPGVEKCTQIDIDEKVTWASQQWFPELCESNDDPRAELLFDDGIAWVKNCEPGTMDLIIIDSTDPVGPAEGLFAVDFYRDCLKALKPEGILVQQSESPLLHSNSIIKKIHEDMKEAGFHQCHTLPFPQPVYPTGWWSCTMASPLGSVTNFRAEDVAAKPFPTEYYNLEIHRAALAMPEFMKRDLGK
ncbi:MAG: spermidine synthase [Pseudomonadales bacterium]|nr:spermidine synthase [Pseudomonadales bacterium]RLU00482.1 MAG: polyamine aminopropyltransferase [Ketobacter sp.]